MLEVCVRRAMVVGWFIVAGTVAASAQTTPLRVNIFPGPQNLALFAAQEKGLFAKRGLAVEIQVTPNSQAQRDGLVGGKFEIAQAGVDNAVALVETANAPVAIVAGGGNGMNDLIVRPEIQAIDDIRGKTVVVDAPNTAYALLLYKMLALKGMTRQQDYAVLPAGGCTQRLDAMKSDAKNVAAMLNPPCSILAENLGYKNFGAGISVTGPYQADGIWVMRPWAAANSEALVKYIAAIIEGIRGASNPANRDEATAIVAKHLKLDPQVAARSVEAAVGPNAGLAKDAAFDLAGFRNTLKLRAEMAGGDPNAVPEKYLDLSFYQRALASF
jgi:ABC-type nitrate/sulfonate/bicarbonate transport system substrate-binding protein